jgi:hypothetical protein
MNTVIDRMASDLELAGYAERTRADYLAAVRDFVHFCGRPCPAWGTCSRGHGRGVLRMAV